MNLLANRRMQGVPRDPAITALRALAWDVDSPVASTGGFGADDAVRAPRAAPGPPSHSGAASAKAVGRQSAARPGASAVARARTAAVAAMAGAAAVTAVALTGLLLRVARNAASQSDRAWWDGTGGWRARGGHRSR